MTLAASILYLFGLFGHGDMVVTQAAILHEVMRIPEVDAALIVAVIQEESGFRWRARGPCGEVGLMQVSLSEVAREGKTVHGAMQPAENIRLGVRKLAQCLTRAHGDPERAIRLYNGAGQVTIDGVVYNSRVHAWRVMRTYWRLKYLLAEREREMLSCHTEIRGGGGESSSAPSNSVNRKKTNDNEGMGK